MWNKQDGVDFLPALGSSQWNAAEFTCNQTETFIWRWSKLPRCECCLRLLVGWFVSSFRMTFVKSTPYYGGWGWGWGWGIRLSSLDQPPSISRSNSDSAAPPGKGEATMKTGESFLQGGGGGYRAPAGIKSHSIHFLSVPCFNRACLHWWRCLPHSESVRMWPLGFLLSLWLFPAVVTATVPAGSCSSSSTHDFISESSSVCLVLGHLQCVWF